MANQINLPKDKELAKKVLDNHNELERQRVVQGYLGKLWGSSSSIPNNIAALAVIVLIITGIFYTYSTMSLPTDKISLPIKDFWAIITPLITLAIGYLFGDKTKKNEP
jgi:hypothetical protein